MRIFTLATLCLISSAALAEKMPAAGADPVVFSCKITDARGNALNNVELSNKDVEYSLATPVRLTNGAILNIGARINESTVNQDGTLKRKMTLSIVERDSKNVVTSSGSFDVQGDERMAYESADDDFIVRCDHLPM